MLSYLNRYSINNFQVSGIVGRADLLSACLSLFVFIIYHRAATDKKISTANNLVIILCCCILSVLAMLCKEQGIMIMVKLILFTLHKKKK